MPTNYSTFEPLPPPEPVPHAIDDPLTILLVRTAQEQLLSEYNTIGTLGCFYAGNTANCHGPWLLGADWATGTLSYHVKDNTAVDHTWYCEVDTTYLVNKEKFFYGWSVENITTSLRAVAHTAATFATAACVSNATCVSAYGGGGNDNLAQMYYDFCGYIDGTFFAYMASVLPATNTRSYCPQTLSSSASMLYIPTTAFNGGKEYFGLHDAAFIPGVADWINGTLEEGKKELGLLLGHRHRKSEGVFLNMVLYSYGTSLGAGASHKRAVGDDDGGDEEVYPGCKRREWIIYGGCKGVVPPREFDLAGEVVPMKDRDNG